MLDGVSNSPLPVAVIDRYLQIVGFSETFAAAQSSWLGCLPKIGDHLDKSWLDRSAREAVDASYDSVQPIFGVATLPPNAARTVHFDFHTLLFDDDRPIKFGVIGLHLDPSDSKVQEPPPPPLLEDAVPLSAGDGSRPVTRFLDETLPASRRLLKRKNQSYLALRTWRKSIKPYQMSALKALKVECPDVLIDLVAGEMAEEITSFFGQVSGHVIVPVPCGHSGPGCLSERLAKAVAHRLSIESVTAFVCATHRGTSHPRKNAMRPKMRISCPIERPVILIDDVATSGAHIEEAGRLLLLTAPSVWSVVWISD